MNPEQLLALLKTRGLQASSQLGQFGSRVQNAVLPAMMGHVAYDKFAPQSWPRMPGMPHPDSVEAQQLPWYMMNPGVSPMANVVQIQPDEEAYFKQHHRLPTRAEKNLNDQSWGQIQQASQVRMKQILDVMAAGRKSGMSTKEIENLVRLAKKNSPNTPGDYIRGTGRYVPNGTGNAVVSGMNLEQNVPTRTLD